MGQAMGVQLGPLLAALALSCAYALRAGTGEGGILQRISGDRRWISAAAGISVAYVFVDILPELAAQNEALRHAAGGALTFAEQRIYVLALISFVVMYGIDHIVLSRRAKRRETVARREYDPAYWLHLGGFAAYSALIGYLLIERAERGPMALGMYSLAMAVHFVVVSHALSEEHGHLYRRNGHWVLATSVLAGWAIGVTVSLSETVFARLFALLAGGVVITSLRSELPDEREGRFWPFCLGSAAFASVLLNT
jgi:hypothetical protein